MQETWVQSLGQEDPLEKEVATHSSILAWRIAWTEKSGGLQSTESQELDRIEQLNHHPQGQSHTSTWCESRIFDLSLSLIYFMDEETEAPGGLGHDLGRSRAWPWTDCSESGFLECKPGIIPCTSWGCCVQTYHWVYLVSCQLQVGTRHSSSSVYPQITVLSTWPHHPVPLMLPHSCPALKTAHWVRCENLLAGPLALGSPRDVHPTHRCQADVL